MCFLVIFYALSYIKRKSHFASVAVSLDVFRNSSTCPRLFVHLSLVFTHPNLLTRTRHIIRVTCSALLWNPSTTDLPKYISLNVSCKVTSIDRSRDPDLGAAGEEGEGGRGINYKHLTWPLLSVWRACLFFMSVVRQRVCPLLRFISSFCRRHRPMVQHWRKRQLCLYECRRVSVCVYDLCLLLFRKFKVWLYVSLFILCCIESFQ